MTKPQMTVEEARQKYPRKEIEVDFQVDGICKHCGKATKVWQSDGLCFQCGWDLFIVAD